MMHCRSEGVLIFLANVSLMKAFHGHQREDITYRGTRRDATRSRSLFITEVGIKGGSMPRGLIPRSYLQIWTSMIQSCCPRMGPARTHIGSNTLRSSIRKRQAASKAVAYVDSTCNHFSVIIKFGFKIPTLFKFDRSFKAALRAIVHCCLNAGGTCPMGKGEMPGLVIPRNAV